MIKTIKDFKTSVLSLLAVTMLISVFPAQIDAFSEQVIQKGATGDDVIELQARLQNYGYHDGKIDGVFGWGTYWSVRNFQNDFGLEVDGYVGDEMKQRLEEFTHFDRDYIYNHIKKGKDPDAYGPDSGPDGEAPQGQRDPGVDRQAPQPEGETAPESPEQPEGETAPEAPEEQAPEVEPETPAAEGEVGQYEEAVNIPGGFSANDINLMANAVYGEGRGEPYKGQVAIAAVILNRVQDEEFPNSVSEVIFEPLAFTAVADGQIYMEPDEQARNAVMDAINGWDPSGGIVYYFNPDTATSDWMFQRERVMRIGKHVFVR